MEVKYVKNPSGYCYKVKGNKKIRISKEEYMKKKTNKTRGGDNQNNYRIHPTNLPKSAHQTIKQCSSRCNSHPFIQKIRCVSKCQEELNNQQTN